MGTVDFLGIKGSFRRPPVLANGLFYAVSATGVVYQLSPRAGAKAKEFARLELGAAGYNRLAVVNLPASATETRGWTLLAAASGGVEALSLATGRSQVIYKPQYPEEMAVNRSDADGTGFKGIAACAKFCAFAVRTSADEIALTLKFFAEDRPVGQPLVLDGREVAGPAMCGRWIMLCTERQAGMYDRETGAASVMDLPRKFTPLLVPSSDELTVPPGSMPLAVTSAAGGDRAMYVAGMQDGRSGVLQINFRQGESVFRALPRGSSMSTNPDGSVCLSTPGEITLLLGTDTEKFAVRTHGGMPAFYDEPYLCTFAEGDSAGEHRLNLARAGRRVEMRFSSMECDRYSCNGVYVLEHDVLVSYLNIFAGEDGEGLRFARFSTTT